MALDNLWSKALNKARKSDKATGAQVLGTSIRNSELKDNGLKPFKVSTPKVDLDPPQPAEIPTFGQRVEKTASGGLLGSGAGFTNALGSLTEGLGNIGDWLQDKKEQRLAAQERQYIEMYREELADAQARGDKDAVKWAQMKLNQAEYRLSTITDMGDFYDDVTQETVDNIYQKADELAAESQKKITEAKAGAGKVGQFLVDAGAAGTQLAGDIAVGVVTGTGAMAPIFIRGYGSGAQQARQNGATYERQVAYGLATATVEALTEKISSVGKIPTKAFGTGAIDDIMKGMVKAVEDHGKTAAGKAALNRIAIIGTGAVGEGFEELVSGLVDPIAQKIYSDEKIDWKQAAYDAGYQFLIGAALGGVTGGIGGTDTSKVDEKTGTSYNEPKVTSPAATPEVQQLNTQAQATQAQNPGVDVLDAATSLFMSEQGCNLKTAQKRAKIVQQLINGEQVDDDVIKKLEPTSKVTKSIFSQLTGVQFPDTPMNLEQVLPLYRTAHDVAVQAQTAVVAQVTEATVAPVQTAAPEVADEAFNQFSGLYREKHQDAADPDVRKLYDAFQSGEQTVTFGGQRLTRDQFVELLRSTGTELSDADLNALFNEVAVNTLSGIDSFDHNNDTLPLTNGGVITRKQFVEFMRGEVRPDATPEELDTLFDRGKDHADKGNPMPYNEAMDKYMKEETSDGRAEEATGVLSGDVESRENSRDAGSGVGGVQARAEQGSGRPLQGRIQENGTVKQTPQQKAAAALRSKNPETTEFTYSADQAHARVLTRKSYTREMRKWEKRAQAFGAKMYFVMGPIYDGSGGKASGLFLPDQNTILIRADSDLYNVSQIAGHELVHRYVKLDDDLRQALNLGVLGNLGVDVDRFDNWIAEQYKSYEKVYGKFSEDNKYRFYEEFYADLNGGISSRVPWTDEQFSYISKIAKDVVAKWESVRFADKAQTELAEQQDTVDKENSEAIKNSDRAFSLDTEALWSDQIDDLDALGDNSSLYIEETPNLLAEVGLGDLPMCMTKGHARDAMHEKDPSNIHWHGVPKGIMQQLPRLLSQPAMILNSRTVKGDILVVTTAVDGDKLPIVAAIRPNGSALVDGVKGPANFITSVYGRSNFAAQPGMKSENNLLYLAPRDRGILYWNKKRTEALAQTTGLRLPRTLEKVPSDTILKQYDGYVKGSTPERMFALDEDEETVQKSEKLANLALFVEEHFPEAPVTKIPDFASWGQAYMHLDEMYTLGKSGLAFDVPPFLPGDTMELLHKDEDGKWAVLAAYEKDAAGLLAFKNDYKKFLGWEKETASVSPEYEENLDYLDIYDDSTAMPGEEDEVEYYRNRQMKELQDEREGFTDTDSENFREWFNDDSGKLTTPTGKPKVFVRGTPFAGSTKLRESLEALSGGLFFSDRVDVAKRYADGATHTGVTAMDRLSGNDNETKEWRPHKLKTWNNARLYIRDNYTDKRHENGMELQGWDPETGELLSSTKAKEFLLRTNLTTRDYRESASGSPLFADDGWRTLKAYPATKEGLDELNHDLGDFIRELGIGTRGYTKVYLSAENTFVVDAGGVSYTSIPDDILPGKLQSGHESGTQGINGLVRRAFEAGYDCVIVENVSDAGGLQTQYVVKNPNQVKSVYNRGTWDKADPDMMYALEPDSELELYLQQLEQEYGAGSPEAMYKAFEALAESRAQVRTESKRAQRARESEQAAKTKAKVDAENQLTAWVIYHTAEMRKQKRTYDAKLEAARKEKIQAVKNAIAETKEIERAKAAVQHDADRMAERRNAAKRLRTKENAYQSKITEMKENQKLKRNAAKATLRNKKLLDAKRKVIETEQGPVDTLRKNPKERSFYERLQGSAENLRTLGRSAYRNFVNMALDIDLFSRRQVSDTRAGTLVTVLGGSSATIESIFKRGLVSRAGDRLGDSMKEVFLCWSDAAHRKVDEAKQALLQDYMLHMHNVDRMSFEAKARQAVTDFEQSHTWLRDMDPKEFARLVAMTEKEAEKFGKEQARLDAIEYDRLIQRELTAKDKPIFADKNGNPVTAETSRSIAAQYVAENPWLVEKAQDIYTWWDNFMREWAVGDSISEAEYETMRQTYPHYVPTYRVDRGDVGGPNFVGMGGATVSKAVRKAKGGTTDVVNIEDSFANLVNKIVRLERTNALYKNIVDTVMLDQDGTFADMAVFDWDWQTGAYGAALETGAMLNGDLEKQVDDTETAGLEKVGQDYKLTAWIDGRKYSAYISADLYTSIGNVTGHLANDFERFVLKVGNTLTGPMKTAITGINPSFALRNLSRDLPTAIVNSISGMAFPKYYARAAKEMTQNSDNWQTFQALGGTHATYYNDNKGFVSAMSRGKNIGSHVVEGLGWFNERTEAQTRFAEYLATIDRLGDTYDNRLQGIKNAAEVTVDFSRKGRIGKAINAWVPYWNPAVQGIDKVVRSVIDSPDGSAVWKQASKTLGRAAMTTVLAEALLYSLRGALDRDDEWEQLSDRVKDTYYCIPLKDSHTFLKIPKNREWGAILGTPFSRMLEYANGRENPFENYIETAIEPNFLPPAILRPDSGGGFATDVIGVSQALDLAKNEDFAGRTIVPYALEQGSLSQQYDAETSVFARKLGELFNWSPMQIDYLIADYFGDFGDLFQMATAEATWTGEQSPAEVVLDMLQSPWLADARYSNQDVSRYYDLAAELETTVTDKKNHSDGDAYKQGIEYQTQKALDTLFGKEITELNKQIREMPDGEEKDAAKARIADLASAAVEYYEDCMAGNVSAPILSAEYSDFSATVSNELIRLDGMTDEYKFLPTGRPSDSYTDPRNKGREYVLDDEQKDYFKQLYREQYDEIFGNLIRSSKYRKASDTKKAELLEDARNDVLEATKDEFFEWLRRNGVRSTPKKK